MKNQINLEIENTSLENQTKKFSLWSKIGFTFLVLFSLNSIQAQTDSTSQEKGITIQGTVSDDSEVLPGVNIFLEGTGIGTETNLKGYFVFPKPLKKGDVLVFSYLGMESKKVIVSNNLSASNIELTVDMNALSTVLLGSSNSKKRFKSRRK